MIFHMSECAWRISIRVYTIEKLQSASGAGYVTSPQKAKKVRASQFISTV